MGILKSQISSSQSCYLTKKFYFGMPEAEIRKGFKLLDYFDD